MIRREPGGKSRVPAAALALLGAALFIGLPGSVGRASTPSPDSALKTPPPPPVRKTIKPAGLPVDSESASVRLGRRENAPLVDAVFDGGLKSLNEVGKAVCYALTKGRVDTLHALCINEREFREILWREFPQSRPYTGLTWQDAWIILNGRLLSGCRGAITDFGGDTLQFVRFDRRDTTAVYKNFKLHNGLVLVAKTPGGEERRYLWLRSVAERKGRFKIYSVTD